MKVGTFTDDDASVGNTVNIGDATNSVDFAGIFTLSLDDDTHMVTLTVKAILPGTGNRYLQVSPVYLPENLRPSVKAVDNHFEGHSEAFLYVFQDGRIHYRNNRNTETVSNSLTPCTLTWDLAYSVIGKDHPTTANWWQIVVPGLDPAGVVGWVPASAVTVTPAHEMRALVTWPPPPYQLNASGTYEAPLWDKVSVDLAWQKPQDLWTGAAASNVSRYRILRGSSPKSLTSQGTTSDLHWKEIIFDPDTFHYAVAGVAGMGRSLRSLAPKVGTGTAPSTPPRPGTRPPGRGRN